MIANNDIQRFLQENVYCASSSPSLTVKELNIFVQDFQKAAPEHLH